MYIQDEKKASGKAIGTMLPYFITILCGGNGIGTDMIAEKRRGVRHGQPSGISGSKKPPSYLARYSLLMTVSAFPRSFDAMVICAPIMMGYMGGLDTGEHRLARSRNYTRARCWCLSFLYSSIIALFSVFAKSTKEASTYVMPAYMLGC